MSFIENLNISPCLGVYVKIYTAFNVIKCYVLIFRLCSLIWLLQVKERQGCTYFP